MSDEKTDLYLIGVDRLKQAAVAGGRKGHYLMDWEYPLVGGLYANAFQSFILDESTKVKNDRSARHFVWEKLLHAIPHRMILTGDPNPHSQLDIWGQMKILDRGQLLGNNFWGFRLKWFTPGPAWKPYDWTITTYKLRQLGELLSTKIIRVLKPM